MKVKTRYFGELEIEEEKIIEFNHGVLGFPQSREFVVVQMPDNPKFRFLQDIHNSYVSFLIISPWDFFKEYEADIKDDELESIRISQGSNKEFTIHLIVTIGRTFEDSTANLIAPIVINSTDKLGRQFILEQSEYSTKHRLVTERSGE